MVDYLTKRIQEKLLARGRAEQARADEWRRSLKPTVYRGNNLFQEMGGEPLKGRYLGQQGLVPGQSVPNIGRNPNKPVIPGLPMDDPVGGEETVVIPVTDFISIGVLPVPSTVYPDAVAYDLVAVTKDESITLDRMDNYEWRPLDDTGRSLQKRLFAKWTLAFNANSSLGGVIGFNGDSVQSTSIIYVTYIGTSDSNLFENVFSGFFLHLKGNTSKASAVFLIENVSDGGWTYDVSLVSSSGDFFDAEDVSSRLELITDAVFENTPGDVDIWAFLSYGRQVCFVDGKYFAITGEGGASGNLFSIWDGSYSWSSGDLVFSVEESLVGTGFSHSLPGNTSTIEIVYNSDQVSITLDTTGPSAAGRLSHFISCVVLEEIGSLSYSVLNPITNEPATLSVSAGDGYSYSVFGTFPPSVFSVSENFNVVHESTVIDLFVNDFINKQIAIESSVPNIDYDDFSNALLEYSQTRAILGINLYKAWTYIDDSGWIAWYSFYEVNKLIKDYGIETLSECGLGGVKYATEWLYGFSGKKSSVRSYKIYSKRYYSDGSVDYSSDIDGIVSGYTSIEIPLIDFRTNNKTNNLNWAGLYNITGNPSVDNYAIDPDKLIYLGSGFASSFSESNIIIDKYRNLDQIDIAKSLTVELPDIPLGFIELSTTGFFGNIVFTEYT